MADDQIQNVKETLTPRRSSRASLPRRAAKKILVPLAASAASAAAGYAAKKGPELLQEKVLPKVREAGGVGALAQQVWEKLAAKVPMPETPGRDAPPTPRRAPRALSHEERERARQEREARRLERRKEVSTS